MSVTRRAKPVLRNSIFFSPDRCASACIYDSHMLPRPALDLNFVLHGQPLSSKIAFTRASLATYFDRTGVLQTAANGVARVNSHVYNGSNWINRGLLIEEARTNLCLQSEDLSTTWVDAAATSVGISINTTVAPDGNTTADTLTDNSAVNFEGLKQTFTVANNSTSWTATAYIKKDSDETRFPELQIQITGGTLQRVNVSLNTKTGAILERASTGTTVVSVQDVGNYWRLRATVNNNTTGNVTLEVFLFPAVGTTLGGLLASTTGSIIVWGLALENAVAPLSYIKTTTVAVTRFLDVATMSDVTWLNQSEGTILVKAIQAALFGAADYLIQIDDGGSSDRLFLVGDTDDKLKFNTTNSGGNDASSVVADVIVAGMPFKAIGAYAQNYVIAGKNGVLDATPDTSVDLPTADVLTTVRIGDSHAGDRTWNGHITHIVSYKQRLPPAILQRLTI